MADRVNELKIQTKVFRPELRFTPNGKAVFNAGFSLGAKLPNERWLNSWYEVVAWEALAEEMAERVSEGDEVLLIGRLGARGYEGREGDVVKDTLTVNSYTVVTAASQQTPTSVPAARTVTDDSDVPF